MVELADNLVLVRRVSGKRGIIIDVRERLALQSGQRKDLRDIGRYPADLRSGDNVIGKDIPGIRAIGQSAGGERVGDGHLTAGGGKGL